MHKNEQKNKLLYTLSPPLMRGRCPSLDFYSGNDYNPTTNGNPCKILFRTPVPPPLPGNLCFNLPRKLLQKGRLVSKTSWQNHRLVNFDVFIWPQALLYTDDAYLRVMGS